MAQAIARRYVTADVFTDRRFGGNPLAVVLDAAGLTDAQMQAIAAEFNYSETTFVLPPGDPRHTARVRIFTASVEVPFAGHPNVGTAFVLARELQASGKPVPERFLFEEKAGLVPVRLMRNGDAVVGAELTAPEPLSRGGAVDAEAVARYLGLSPADIRIDRHAPQVCSVGLPFLVAELVSREALKRLDRNLAPLPFAGADAIYLYTRAGDLAGCDVQARMFVPGDSVAEDPATGSATAATVALLAELHGGDLALRFGQGFDLGRPSLLDARVERGEIRVGGRCVPVMAGMIEV